MDDLTMPREMTGAELQSMLKSNVNFKSLGGQRSDELTLPESDKKWWRDAKIGFFVHWGLYSILGRGEWVRHQEQIPWDEYCALADQFNPQDFEMSEWAQLAQDFGAKYMVMVARHHDGFALWDSPGSWKGFTSANTASGRDFVKEYTDACREKGMRVGIYYSTMDWRFPGYFDPKGQLDNALEMKQQAYDQINELCGNYGPVDIIWYDGSWLAHSGSDTSSAWLWEPVKLNKEVRKHNPKTLINPRSGWEGDFYCDEGSHAVSGKIIPVPWEKNMCVCSGSSWGWMPNDPVRSFDWLINMMVNVICRDGNWLVNVGPDKDGKVPREAADRLREIGRWLDQYGESVYGTRGGPFEPVDNVCGATCRGKEVYVHVQDQEAFKTVTLEAIPQKILSCKLLKDGTDVPFEQTDSGVRIHLPDLPKAPDTIVKLMVDSDIPERTAPEVYFTGKE